MTLCIHNIVINTCLGLKQLLRLLTQQKLDLIYVKVKALHRSNIIKTLFFIIL